MQDATDAVEIFRSYWRQACDERGFVLHAVGIASQVGWNGRTWSLFVPAEAAADAIRHLVRYEQENPPRRRMPIEETSHPAAWVGAACYVLVLLVVGFLAGRWTFGEDWYAVGAAQAGALRAGEPWRFVTALTLHVDVGHLLANLGFGSVFGLLAGQLLGPGLAWATVVLAASLANACNSMIQPAGYSSVGASTAVFATLGLLAAYSWRRRNGRGERWAYRWAPLVAGVALLAFTGVGGERTDVMAHLTGFVAGALGGFLLAWRSLRVGPVGQFALSLGALAAVGAAWALALGTRF